MKMNPDDQCVAGAAPSLMYYVKEILHVHGHVHVNWPVSGFFLLKENLPGKSNHMRRLLDKLRM